MALGEALKRHATFHALLEVLGGSTVDLDVIAASLARQRSAWRDDPALARRSLLSLLGLVSAARSWRPELVDATARREERDSPRPVQPFVEVRLQLWLRELTRMVATVERNPRLRHSADLDEEARKRHLPVVHCRECGAMGWGTVVQRDKPHLLRTTLEDFYRAYFHKDSRVAFLFPRDAVPERDPAWKRAAFAIDSETLVRVEPGERAEGPVFEVIQADSVHSTARGPKLSRDCPFCGARESLTIVGFRAATLTSVFIDQLFASPFNTDKKLLTFSDSVQDAAHRAGFFGARTWRTNLRVALLQVILENEGLPLSELAKATARSWRQRMDEATWISTFLAPDMAWLHDWETLKRTGELPAGSDLELLISRRLAFEVFSEFGLQAGIGRSLPRTGTATVRPPPELVERAVGRLLELLRNEVPGLREVRPEEIRHFVVGLLHHLRLRGGILSSSLPTEYVESVGKDLHAFRRDQALRALGPSSRLPALLVDRPRTRSFDTWTGKEENGLVRPLGGAVLRCRPDVHRRPWIHLPGGASRPGGGRPPPRGAGTQRGGHLGPGRKGAGGHRPRCGDGLRPVRPPRPRRRGGAGSLARHAVPDRPLLGILRRGRHRRAGLLRPPVRQRRPAAGLHGGAYGAAGPQCA